MSVQEAPASGQPSDGPEHVVAPGRKPLGELGMAALLGLLGVVVLVGAGGGPLDGLAAMLTRQIAQNGVQLPGASGDDDSSKPAAKAPKRTAKPSSASPDSQSDDSAG